MKRFLAVVLFLAACATVPPQPPMASQTEAEATTLHVLVVSTTDLHGWYDGHHEGSAPSYGGLALFADYLEALRAHHAVVLVDSGDLFQGTLDSNIFEGEPVIKGYNALGYAASAVGNHEFDYGPVGPDSVARTPDQDPLGALKHNAAMAKFPFLSANLTEKATGRTPSWARRYTIVAAGGAKIGIIGLSTPDTPNVTMPANVTTLVFGDPVKATVEAARELRAQGADAVVVIAHMGGRCRSVDTDPHDSSSCEKEQEAMTYLAALPKGTIDAYFAGHTHFQMHHYINDVPALQPLALGREFSTLDLTIDPRQHRVVTTTMQPLTMICAKVYSGTETCDPKKAPTSAQLVPRMFEGQAMAPIGRVAELLKPYVDKVAAKRNEPLNLTTTGRFTRVYRGESTLGDLINDATRMYLGADIAVLNSGAIRADLPAGPLVYANIFDVSPFDNFPAVVTLTGVQVTEILRLTTTGDRGFLQTSGLRYTVDAALDTDKPAAQRNRLTSVMLADGKPLDPTALYRVAMVDFLAAGGDGLEPVMKNVPADRIKIDYTRPIREVLIDALRKLPQPLTPKTDGRIKMLNAKEGANDSGR